MNKRFRIVLNAVTYFGMVQYNSPIIGLLNFKGEKMLTYFLELKYSKYKRVVQGDSY